MTPGLPPELPPGVLEPTLDPAAIRAQAERNLAECGAIVDGLMGKINAAVDDCVRSCGGVWANCEACIQGKANEILSNAEAVAGKCAQKIIERAYQRLHEAVALAAPTVDKVPGLSAIAHEVMTGLVPVPSAGAPAPSVAPSPAAEAMPTAPATTFLPPNLVDHLPQPGGAPESTSPPGQVLPGPGFDQLPAPPAPALLLGPPAQEIQPTADRGAAYRPGDCTDIFSGVQPWPPTPEMIVCPPGMVGVWVTPTGQPIPPNYGVNGLYCASCVPKAPTGGGGTGTPRPPGAPPPPPPPTPPSSLPPPGTSLCPPHCPTPWDDLAKPTSGDTIADLGIPEADATNWCDPFGAANWCIQSSDVPFSGAEGKSPSDLFGFTSGGKASVPKWMQPAKDFLPAVIFGPLWAFYASAALTLDIAAEIATPFVVGCSSGRLLLMASASSLYKLCRHWLGFSVGPVNTAIEQQENVYCPNKVPSESDVVAMYLADEITRAQAKGALCAHGICEQWSELILNAVRRRPGVSESLELFRRGILQRPDLVSRLRDLGATDPNELQQLIALAEQFPGPGELIHYLASGNEDANDSQALGLEEDFPGLNNQGTIDWWEQTGLSAGNLRRQWAAHWDRPGRGDIIEFIRRLRKDSTVPEAKAAAMSDEDIDRLLRLAGVPKGLRPAVKAVSTIPLGLRHLRLAFEMRIIDAATAKSKLQDAGYSAHDCDLVVTAWDRLRRQKAGTQFGSIRPAEVIDWYQQGTLNEAGARGLLTKAGWSLEQIDEALDYADTSWDSEHKARLLKMVKRRYMVGDLDRIEAQVLVNDIGIDTDRVADILDEWELEIQVRSRMPATEKLCSWYSNGLITASEYATRLQRIGWQESDTQKIILECTARLVAKIGKEIEQAQKEAERLAARAAREAEKAAALIRKRRRAELRRQRELCHPDKPCADGTPDPLLTAAQNGDLVPFGGE